MRAGRLALLAVVFASGLMWAGDVATAQEAGEPTWSGTFETERESSTSSVTFFSTFNGTISRPDEGGPHRVEGQLTEYGWEDSCSHRIVEPVEFTFNVSLPESDSTLYMADEHSGGSAVGVLETNCDGDISTRNQTIFVTQFLFHCGSQLLGPITEDPTNASLLHVDAATTDQCSLSGLANTFNSSATLEGVTRELRDCDGVFATLDAEPNSDYKGESKEVEFTVGPRRAGWRYDLRLMNSGVTRQVSPGVHTFTFPVPDEYVATLLVTTPNGCTVTDSVRYAAGAVTAYTPTVYLHPAENYLPGNADEFISRSQLIHHRTPLCGGWDRVAAGRQAREIGGAKQMALLTGRLSAKRGAPYGGFPKVRIVETDNGRRCRTNTVDTVKTSDRPVRYVLRKNDNYSGFFLNLLDREEWRWGNLDTARVYYSYKFEEYVAYWFFYPYNRWNRAGVTEIHEGDWEHVVIKLDENNVATHSAFYQHVCDPKIALWNRTPRDPAFRKRG